MTRKPRDTAPSRNWEWVSPSAARVIESDGDRPRQSRLRRVARAVRSALLRLTGNRRDGDPDGR